MMTDDENNEEEEEEEEEEKMHCVVMLNSFLTSNATITLSDFHMNGIPDGYKYVPKAVDVVPPYYIEHYIPEKHMKLAIVTDLKLFSQSCNQLKQAMATESANCDARMSEEELVIAEDPYDILYGVD